MKTFLFRICALLAVVGLTLLPAEPGASDGGQDGWRPEPPRATEVAALEEVSGWLEASAPRIAGRPGVPEGLRRAMRQRTESFDVFHRFHGPESGRPILDRLPYGAAIFSAANAEKVDPLLLAAVVEAESNFRPAARSPVGAIGLTQMMPTTAQVAPEDLVRPQVSLKLGARYLGRLLKRFDGDLELALAAYNAGPGAVQRFSGVPPYRETQRYVDKVLAIYVEHLRQVWRSSDVSDALAAAG